MMELIGKVDVDGTPITDGEAEHAVVVLGKFVFKDGKVSGFKLAYDYTVFAEDTDNGGIVLSLFTGPWKRPNPDGHDRHEAAAREGYGHSVPSALVPGLR